MPNPRPLTPKRYAELLSDVQKLNQAAESAGTDEKVHAYWRMGRRIARERLAQDAGYHNTVLRDLAQDARVAVRTLQRAVRFHLVYPEPPAPSGLSWSHYQVLIQLATDHERARYQALAYEQNLSARHLAAAIDAGLADATSTPPLIERPTEPSYVYAATLHHIVDGDTLILHIDLGFHVLRRQRIRLARVDAPELDTPEGRAARDFLAKRLLPAQSIVVQTRRHDRYARYVAHLFYSPRPLSIDACFTHGHHLNDELLQSGHARLA
jgi:endonuclease YncB( thermonuclease family)